MTPPLPTTREARPDCQRGGFFRAPDRGTIPDSCTATGSRIPFEDRPRGRVVPVEGCFRGRVWTGAAPCALLQAPGIRTAHEARTRPSTVASGPARIRDESAVNPDRDHDLDRRACLALPPGAHHGALRHGGRSTISRVSDTRSLLARLEQGDRAVASELLPLLYEELHRLAAERMRRENVERTLGATGLVHEAYLRLVGDPDREWNGRAHFFGAAAARDAATSWSSKYRRRKTSLKRDGNRARVDLEESEAGWTDPLRGHGREHPDRPGRGPRTRLEQSRRAEGRASSCCASSRRALGCAKSRPSLLGCR